MKFKNLVLSMISVISFNVIASPIDISSLSIDEKDKLIEFSIKYALKEKIDGEIKENIFHYDQEKFNLIKNKEKKASVYDVEIDDVETFGSIPIKEGVFLSFKKKTYGYDWNKIKKEVSSVYEKSDNANDYYEEGRFFIVPNYNKIIDMKILIDLGVDLGKEIDEKMIKKAEKIKEKIIENRQRIAVRICKTIKDNNNDDNDNNNDDGEIDYDEKVDIEEEKKYKEGLGQESKSDSTVKIIETEKEIIQILVEEDCFKSFKDSLDYKIHQMKNLKSVSVKKISEINEDLYLNLSLYNKEGKFLKIGRHFFKGKEKAYLSDKERLEKYIFIKSEKSNINMDFAIFKKIDNCLVHMGSNLTVKACNFENMREINEIDKLLIKISDG